MPELKGSERDHLRELLEELYTQNKQTLKKVSTLSPNNKKEKEKIKKEIQEVKTKIRSLRKAKKILKV